MTSQPFQPGAPLPPGYDEGDLLALVDGLPLPAERAARVREVLANDSQLAELVAMLRADRDALVSLPTATPSAPADLLDRVEAQLERDALVGLARSESFTAEETIPVSTVLPPRRVLIGPRMAGVLAAAAAVALIAGGVLMMMPSGKGAKVAPAGGGLATHTHAPSPADTLAKSEPELMGPMPDESPSRGPDLATNARTGPETGATTVGTDPALATASSGPSMEELIAAAQNGRLVLRLRTDEKTARARLDDLNVNARTIRVQALGVERSSVFVGALADAMRPRPVTPVIKPDSPETQPAYAIGNDPSKTSRPGPSVARPERPEQPNLPAPEFAGQSFVASLPAAAESLEALRKAVSKVGGEWQILPEGAGVRVEPPTDAASVLWWTAPATEWGPRFTIPVVVQTN